jgi:glycosyltransferase involved in cell wall biosynthesis
MNQLAIVIPAYKIEYFEQTLNSIANQTSKDFTLYIGDDASNDNLYSLINKFESRINLKYKRFENNLGSIDLVAHWDRCIEMVGDEEWIWLFSDDDIMEKECITSFYSILKEDNKTELFHFNVKVIDEKNKILNTIIFPEKYTVEEFLKDRLIGKIDSFVVEYIFKKSVYFENFKFQKFDLAWCSDDATWIKFAKNNGIRTISGSYVNWRRSNYNISCVSENHTILLRKYYAFVEFAKWLKSIVDKQQINMEIREFDRIVKLWFHVKLKSSFLHLESKEIYLFVHIFNKQLGKKYFNQLEFLKIISQKTFHQSKKLLSKIKQVKKY